MAFRDYHQDEFAKACENFSVEALERPIPAYRDWENRDISFDAIPKKVRDAFETHLCAWAGLI
jgi:hypothetical protein